MAQPDDGALAVRGDDGLQRAGLRGNRRAEPGCADHLVVGADMTFVDARRLHPEDQLSVDDDGHLGASLMAAGATKSLADMLIAEMIQMNQYQLDRRGVRQDLAVR